MKPNLLSLILLSTCCLLLSCTGDYTYEVAVPTTDIAPISPRQNAVLDLNDRSADTYTFTWHKTDVTGYTLVLSGNDVLTPCVYIPADDADSCSVDAEQLDRIASEAGVVSGRSGTLYWAVKPSDHLTLAAPEIRPLNVKRLISRLLVPENAAAITLDGERPELPVNFSWDTEGEEPGTGYSLVFSSNSEMTGETVAYPVGAVRSAGITQNQLQETCMKYASHPFETLRLYWNVRKTNGGEYLSRTASSVQVDPMRIFKDTRGDEEITYRVAKIVYTDGRVQYWLADNLRTRKYRDGTDIAPADLMFAPASAFSEAQIEAFGGYYRPNPSMFERLPAAGWRIPTIAEFRDLYAEAQAQEGTYNVLRDPVFYDYEPTRTDPLADKWKLSLVTGGQQQGEEKTITNTTYCYLMATGIGEDIHRAAMLDHGAIWEVWSVGSNVRLIYDNR